MNMHINFRLHSKKDRDIINYIKHIQLKNKIDTRTDTLKIIFRKAKELDDIKNLLTQILENQEKYIKTNEDDFKNNVIMTKKDNLINNVDHINQNNEVKIDIDNDIKQKKQEEESNINLIDDNEEHEKENTESIRLDENTISLLKNMISNPIE
ncbi:MAG: hypothetical protein ACOCP8_07985 [archaeon]